MSEVKSVVNPIIAVTALLLLSIFPISLEIFGALVAFGVVSASVGAGTLFAGAGAFAATGGAFIGASNVALNNGQCTLGWVLFGIGVAAAATGVGLA
jgi:hypothetical protein